MEFFLKATIGMVISLICYLLISKQGKDFSVLLTVATCTLIAISTLNYIAPIINFIHTLEQLGNLDTQIIQIMLRAVGIGFLAEIVSPMFNDAGNAAMGKMLQFLAATIILWLSIPLFTKMIDLIKEILQAI